MNGHLAIVEGILLVKANRKAWKGDIVNNGQKTPPGKEPQIRGKG